MNKKIEKIVEQFDSAHERICTAHELEIESVRKRIVLKRVIVGIMLVIFLVGAILNFIKIETALETDIYFNLPTVAIVALVIGVVLMLIGSKSEKKYVNIFKQKVIADLVKSVDENLEYSQFANREDNILERYVKPCFDQRQFNASYVRDNIVGVIDEGLKINMANIHLEKRTGSENRNKSEQLFNGMFADIDGIKKIKATIKIFANNNVNAFAFGIPKATKLEMDSQGFEKKFDVYTTNKLITMQILTSDIMEMLIEFRNILGRAFEIVIQQGHIYVRFDTGDIFEPKVFKSSVDKKRLMMCYLVLVITKELSQRIDETIKNADI